MRYHAFRLLPEQDLKETIVHFVNEHGIKAGVILTCVGSLTKATLRLADENITKTFEQKFEIVSLVGTLSPEGCHLHVSLSDEKGNTIGGHMKGGCIVYTTAEIVIGEIDSFIFSRQQDSSTGFKELAVKSL